MGKDAWGAEWGRYFRSKSKPTRPPISCIYLLYKRVQEQGLFAENVIVKVGRTKRHPLTRRGEAAWGAYHGLCYWPVDAAGLNAIEQRILAKFREEFGGPVKGREYFLAESRSRAVHIAQTELGSTEGFSL